MSDPSFAVQKAIFAALGPYGTNASALKSTSLGCKVLDYLPDNEAMPYVTIGEDQVIGERVLNTPWSDVHVTVHVWSQAKGAVEIKGLAAQVRSALDRELSLDGHTCYVGRHVSTQTMVEADNCIRHAVIMFEYRTEPSQG